MLLRIIAIACFLTAKMGVSLELGTGPTSPDSENCFIMAEIKGIQDVVICKVDEQTYQQFRSKDDLLLIIDDSRFPIPALDDDEKIPNTSHLQFSDEDIALGKAQSAQRHPSVFFEKIRRIPIVQNLTGPSVSEKVLIYSRVLAASAVPYAIWLHTNLGLSAMHSFAWHLGLLHTVIGANYFHEINTFIKSAPWQKQFAGIFSIMITGMIPRTLGMGGLTTPQDWAILLAQVTFSVAAYSGIMLIVADVGTAGENEKDKQKNKVKASLLDLANRVNASVVSLVFLLPGHHLLKGISIMGIGSIAVGAHVLRYFINKDPGLIPRVKEILMEKYESLFGKTSIDTRKKQTHVTVLACEDFF